MADTITTNHSLTKADDGGNSHAQFITNYGNNLDKIDEMAIIYRQTEEPTNKVAEKTIWVDSDDGVIKLWTGFVWEVIAFGDIAKDTTPELGGEMGCGEHSIGFTEKANTPSAGTVTIDWKDSNKQKVTLDQNTTISFIAPSNPCSLLLRIIQDGTGGRTVTLSSGIKWPGGNVPTFSTEANSIDILSLYYDGSTYYGQAGIAFS